ncbi:MAG: Nif3-like dinuclear metal center hexameric protein [Clostridia bacterium]|nr:Nif3-like dinuclear metal center hexameric protein [Clostridia bacterium]
MTVRELYEKLDARMPETDREPWDNDGIMCCPDSSTDVCNVLITLDVTEEVVDYAIGHNFDLIISHHPLIFKPIGAINEDDHIARKIIKLISNNISVFSFHTRADKAVGGVNDILARLFGLTKVERFGEGGLGRVGEIEECELDVFLDLVKTRLGADALRVADGYNTVSRVAVVGGDGKDFVRDAIACGADTYVSGRISYNLMEEASELGINLIEAGHYFTEAPITGFFADLVSAFDGNAYVEIVNSNMIKLF